MVTGGGKTIFAEMCMLSFANKYPKGRIIIIVPTTALMDQWYVSLREDLGVPSDCISYFSGEEKSDKPNAVNLLVINTARSVATSLSQQSESFLIVDECHRAGSPVNAKALEGKHQATLGLSATPEREYDEGFERYIVPALGSPVYKYDYAEAHKDGVISPFKLVNVKVDMLADEQRRYDELSRRVAREFHREDKKASHGGSERLKRLLQQRAAVSASATMRIPIAAKLVDLHKGHRTLVFHERVDKAEALNYILLKRQHSVTIYHSQIAPAVRRDNLRLYRAGIFDVLVSCRALDEGTNVPETEVAIIASSTASTRQRIQRLGRVLRPAAGKESAVIYTIYATEQEEQRLRDEATQMGRVASVEWRRGSANKRG